MEKKLLGFQLPMIENVSIIEAICSLGYSETGNKFSVNFNGSKGYLDNIEISCEGVQKENNRINVNEFRNKNRTFKKKQVNVYYSEENGVRISIGSN